MGVQTNVSDSANEVVARLGRRVRALRKGQSMTVQDLADRSGLSRRLLTQIELGQGNPSLVTVDRIAKIFGVDFAALTAARDTAVGSLVVYDSDHASLIWSSPAGSTAHLLINSEHRGGPELWAWVLNASDQYVASPDPKGSEELFVVAEGELTIVVEEGPMTVRPGGSARLRSDRAYSYENRSDRPVRFHRVVSIKQDA